MCEPYPVPALAHHITERYGVSMENKKDFDYTSMNDFMTCRRLYDLRHNRGYRAKRPATALAFGGAIGKALDSWYTDKDTAKAVSVFKAEYKEDLETDDKRTHAMGTWILENYDRQYRDQPWELVHTEMTFKHPLPNGNSLIGRVDKVIRWGNTLWGVDHKTTSQLGGQFFNFAEPNLQFPGYSWALIQKGYDVKGFVVDAILVAKGLLPGPKKNANLTPTARYDIYHKPEILAEWMDTVHKIQADIKGCEDTGTWYPNFTACQTKYGDCEYRRVCKEDQDIRQRVLDMDYVIDFWNPLTFHEAAA